MMLSLQNDLTNYVVREVSNTSVKIHGLGNSMTTGKDEFITPVDSFLGTSLVDKNILLKSVTKNLSYGVNLTLVAKEYLSSMVSALQTCIQIINSVGTVSSDKLPVLQNGLDDKIAQVNLLIKRASFDNRSLFSSGANIDMQVGTSAADKLSIRIQNIDGTLFRSRAVNALNRYLGSEELVGGYDTKEAQATAVMKRDNFAVAADNDLEGDDLAEAIEAVQNDNDFLALTQVHATPQLDHWLRGKYRTDLDNELAHNPYPPAGHNARADTLVQVMAGIAAMEDINIIAARVERVAGIHYRDVFLAYGLHATLQTAPLDALEYVMNGLGVRNELRTLFQDNQEMSLTSSSARALTHEIMLGALSTIREMQADIANQKTNVIEISNALRASHNVIQQASDSYIKTNYVLTSQQLAEAIKCMTASITMLQASNKISETILKLLESNT